MSLVKYALAEIFDASFGPKVRNVIRAGTSVMCLSITLRLRFTS